jgi:hypothetical protein
MKNVPGKNCPITIGYLNLDERDQCPRYCDDCETCNDWADEEERAEDAHKKRLTKYARTGEDDRGCV